MKRKKKARMGRPPLGANARTIRIVIKATANEKVAWLKASKAAGMMLGPWLLKDRRVELAAKPERQNKSSN
jgi:hypothetical protein